MDGLAGPEYSSSLGRRQQIELLPFPVPAEAYDMNSTGELKMSFIDTVSQPKLNAWSYRELAPSELQFVSGGIPNYPSLFAKLFGY
jgi:hypothetical protein